MSPWRILPTVVFYNAVKAKAFLEYVPISLKKKNLSSMPGGGGQYDETVEAAGLFI